MSDILARVFQTVLAAAPNTWQRQLYQEFLAGKIPEALRVPTAGGKTAILLIHVAALAAQIATGAVTLPRRLVLAVNRRVLVDQATDLAEALDAALKTPELAEVAALLRQASAMACPLAITTLRGELADNRQWSLDPACPALILATPDMLGSRLLFRGYGLGRSRRALEAGLLGIDTLVVHDEAHLAPTFNSLLREIETAATYSATAVGRPRLRVLEMTATTARADVFVGRIGHDDHNLLRRLHAAKHLRLVPLEIVEPDKPKVSEKGNEKTATKAAEKAAEKALCQARIAAFTAAAVELRTAGLPVVLFIDLPEEVAQISAAMRKAGIAGERILALTGTQRGHERNEIGCSAAMQLFRQGRRSDGDSYYFLCTSAGEIGLDIDGLAGISDLVTLDRMIQRFGRINRQGQSADATITVLTPPRHLLSERLLATLELLESLPLNDAADAEVRDASPLTLDRLLEDRERYLAAVPPTPPRRQLESSLLDLWAMTSLDFGTMPEIHQPPLPDIFIHDLDADDQDIEIAWRTLPESIDDEDWLAAIPLRREELARQPRYRLKELLQAWAETAGGSGCLLLLPGGGLQRASPEKLLTKEGHLVRPGTTLIVPSAWGGLSKDGLPSAAGVRRLSDPEIDPDLTRRVHLFRSGTGWRFAEVGAEATDASNAESSSATGVDFASLGEALLALKEQFGDFIADPPLPATLEHEEALAEASAEAEDDEGEGDRVNAYRLWLLPVPDPAPDERDRSAQSEAQRLEEHLQRAAQAARCIGDALKLSPTLHADLVAAARNHDRGKAERRWQEAFGCTDSGEPLAKSGNRQPPQRRRLDGYRHELGSVASLDGESELVSDLVSHLIAAHHGWARPHFANAALNKALPSLGGHCKQAGIESSARFAVLQKQYGWWGLAYLEALTKCADIHASQPSEE